MQAPKTLDYLAGQFVAHKYDTKWLFRTITATAAYQRESRSRHLPGQTPFAANCPQRLRGDELFDSLVAALGLHNERLTAPGARGAGKGARKKQLEPRNVRMLFDAVFNYDPSVRRDEVGGSIPQALVLMNAPQLARAESARGRLRWPSCWNRIRTIRPSSASCISAASPGNRSRTK